uniref:YqiA/YcfP family alpha/beta fold hydrolase n=1 Tax=Leyella stercorea TaxID=363265 RepID=UPI003FEF4680
GKQVFQNPREDGVQEFVVTKGLIKEYQEMTTHNFEHAADPEERTRVIGLFGDNDPVVHTYDIFHEHYPTAIGFHGEHRLTDKVAMHYLIPVIRYIDDRQEGRERPVIYVDIETLRDSYGNATASMHKAYEMLIEHYNVYVLAPSPSDNAQQMVADAQWVEQFLSAPAWGRIVFTNQRQMLYGDYLITPAAQPKPTLQEQPEFMGTQIEWGSDEFKTWEEIIVFFDRLGGQ